MGSVLDGRVAIVTGAASGFGAATARRFVEEGAKVLLADVNEEGAKSVAESLGEHARGIGVDVSNAPQVAAMVDAAVQAFGGLDILVNNAGLIHAKYSVEDVPLEEFDRVVNVNLRGPFLGIKYAVPALRESAHAVILNTASVGALVPRALTSIYSATKAAIMMLTRSAAIDLGPQIRVNAVCPLTSPTGLLAPGAASLGLPYDDFVARLENDARQSVPLGRLLRPDEVAAALTFLASDEAAFITGVSLPIDGGRSAGDPSGKAVVLAGDRGGDEQ